MSTTPISWYPSEVMKDHKGNPVTCKTQLQIQSFPTNVFALISWIDKSSEEMMVLFFNFVENLVEAGPDQTIDAPYLGSSNLFSYYMEQQYYVGAYVQNCETEANSMWLYEVDSEEGWSELDITLPSQIGYVTSVTGAIGVPYLFGSSTSSEENSVVVRYNVLSDSYDYLGEVGFASNPADQFPIMTSSFLDPTGNTVIMAVSTPFPTTENFSYVMVKPTTNPIQISDSYELTQTSSAPPSLAQGPDGNILMAYTGTDGDIFTLTFDIEAHEWTNSTKITTGGNAHSGIAPSVINTGAGMYIFWVDSSNNLNYIREMVPSNQPIVT